MFSPMNGNRSSMLLNKKRVAAQRKNRSAPRWGRQGSAPLHVSRAGLIERERAQRIGAASEESLRQRNGTPCSVMPAGAAEGCDHAELGCRARTIFLVSRLVCRVCRSRNAAEAALGSQKNFPDTPMSAVL